MNLKILLQAEAIEESGIERIPEDTRQATPLRQTMMLWWSANAATTAVAVGTLSGFFGLGLWWSTGVIIIFTLLGAFPVAFLATWGPKTGLAQMPLSRFAFGYHGAKFPALFNAIACIGWNTFSTVIGAQLIVAWSKGAIPTWVGIALLTPAVTLVGVYGYFLIQRIEGIAWMPMALLLGIVALGAGTHVLPSSPAVAGLGLFAGTATFGGAVLAHSIGWASCAADYYRYQPGETPPARVFWSVVLGLIIPSIPLEVLGMLLWSGAERDVGAMIAQAIPVPALVGPVLLLLALSTIANNVPAGYSLGLSLQMMGWKNIQRWKTTVIGGAASLALALVIAGRFSEVLESFLLLTAYWVGAWCAIVLVEHWLRRGQYPAEAADAPHLLPTGRAALVAMLVGLIVAGLGIHQSFFEGPLARLCGGADLGYPLAMLAAGFSYLLLRQQELPSHSMPALRAGADVPPLTVAERTGSEI